MAVQRPRVKCKVWNDICVVRFLNFKGFSSLPGLLRVQELSYISTQEHRSLFLFEETSFSKWNWCEYCILSWERAKPDQATDSFWPVLSLSLNNGGTAKIIVQIMMLFVYGVLLASSVRLGLGITHGRANSLVCLIWFIDSIYVYTISISLSYFQELISLLHLHYTWYIPVLIIQHNKYESYKLYAAILQQTLNNWSAFLLSH